MRPVVAVHRSTFAMTLGACLFIAVGVASSAHGASPPTLVRSARSGAWSSAATWEKGQVPGAGARVQVRSSHEVVYDAASDDVIRSIHVAGTLVFARDRDTRLVVGLIKIQ